MSTWLAENPELLEAALEIVDTWDVDNRPKLKYWPWPVTAVPSESSEADRSDDIGSSSGDDVSTTVSRLPSLVATRSPAPARGLAERRRLQPSTVSSTHHRRREEIKHLQSTLQELEWQLASANSMQRDRHQTADGEYDEALMRAGLWRDIAARQYQLRTVAESTQANLRHRIDAQAKVARGLIKLIQKARRLESAIDVQIPRAAFTNPQLAFDGHDQLARIKLVHARMDEMFASPKFRDRTVQFLDIQQLDGRHGEFVVQIAEAWSVPFDQHRVLDALWQYSFRRLSEKWCAPEFTQDTTLRVNESELAAHIHSAATIGPVRGTIDNRALVKRFRGDGATVPAIVTCYVGTPNSSDPGDFAGVRTLEESCVRVLPRHTARNVGPMSRVEFSQRFTVTFTDDARERHEKGLFTNLILGKLREMVGLLHDVVETQLLHPQT